MQPASISWLRRCPPHMYFYSPPWQGREGEDSPAPPRCGEVTHGTASLVLLADLIHGPPRCQGAVKGGVHWWGEQTEQGCRGRRELACTRHACRKPLLCLMREKIGVGVLRGDEACRSWNKYRKTSWEEVMVPSHTGRKTWMGGHLGFRLSSSCQRGWLWGDMYGSLCYQD